MTLSRNVSLYKIEQNRITLGQSYLREQLQKSKAVLFYVINEEVTASTLESFLNPAELTEYASFQDKGRKHQYVVSRWLLKNLLEAVLNIPANEIAFEKFEMGKLFLSESQNSLNLDFNISHTKEITLLGFCKKQQIGVDVEKIRDKQSSSQVANRFFQPHEINWINEIGLSENLRLTRFYRLWSLKEAVIKAFGGGVFKNIQQFYFEERNGRLRLNSSLEPWSRSDHWEIFEFNEIPQHACSVAFYQPNSKK